MKTKTNAFRGILRGFYILTLCVMSAALISGCSSKSKGGKGGGGDSDSNSDKKSDTTEMKKEDNKKDDGAQFDVTQLYGDWVTQNTSDNGYGSQITDYILLRFKPGGRMEFFNTTDIDDETVANSEYRGLYKIEGITLYLLPDEDTIDIDLDGSYFNDQSDYNNAINSVYRTLMEESVVDILHINENQLIVVDKEKQTQIFIRSTESF